MTTAEITKPAPTSLVLRRTFNAPVDRVYNAWLTPEVMVAFLGGDFEDHKVLDVKVDPRVGGRYRITWDTPKGVWYVGGAYKELVKNERIVCDWTWEEDDPSEVQETMLTLEFRALSPTQTELVLTHVNLRSEESRDGHANGWTSIVDRLAKALE